MKWEYLVVEIKAIRSDNEIDFDLYGAIGWELVAVWGNNAYFKRPKSEIEESPKLVGYYGGKVG